MRILRFDSVGGASGNMILGALVGLGVDPAVLEARLRKLIPDHFHIRKENKSSFGVSGVWLDVDVHEHSHGEKHNLCEHSHGEEHNRCEHSHGEEHNHCEHSHIHGRSFAAIRELILSSDLDEKTKRDSLAAFSALAEAEAQAHSVPVDEVHFHEVGAVDSIVDTVGCALALNLLEIDGVSLSPLPVGEGTFVCAHGVYPLPAPATAILLEKYALPTSNDVERCEMLTPTATSLFAVWKKLEIPSGAKIVASANSFGTREMKTRPNLLRASIYEYDDSAESTSAPLYEEETLWELEANIDDSSGEILAFASTKLFEVGARDAWLEPIQMKKGRPAWKLCALVDAENKEAVLDAFFRQTSTFGARETPKKRYALKRRQQEVEVFDNKVRVKIGSNLQGDDLTFAPEFEDCRAVAEATNAPIESIYRKVLAQSVKKP